MIPIAHRVNTLVELVQLPADQPIEFDVRDSGGILTVGHDPFVPGIPFDHFLPSLGHRFCIVNIKSEGIEPTVISRMDQNGTTNFFLLDCSVPMMYRLAAQGERRFAVRFSQMEPVEFVMLWAGKAAWVWIDCFTHLPLDKQTERLFHSVGFKLCLVSPELQGRPQDLSLMKQSLVKQGIQIDAVCTKSYNMWRWT